MTTAYQVGKGYLQKAFDALDDEGGDTEADGLSLSSNVPATQSTAGTLVKDEPKENIGKVSESYPENSGGDIAEDSTATSETLPAEFALSENVLQTTQMVEDEPAAEEQPQPRPKRMTFRKSSS